MAQVRGLDDAPRLPVEQRELTQQKTRSWAYQELEFSQSRNVGSSYTRPTRPNYPKCSISNSVSTRTFRAGWCPGGRTMKIPISVSGYRFMSATNAPDANSFSIKNSGSAAMPSPATAAAARASPLSALNRPYGCTGIVLSPSMKVQVSVPCMRHSCARSCSGVSGAPCSWTYSGLPTNLPRMGAIRRAMRVESPSWPTRIAQSKRSPTMSTRRSL